MEQDLSENFSHLRIGKKVEIIKLIDARCRFKWDSPLDQYINQNIGNNENISSIKWIILTLDDYFRATQLIDNGNPTVVVCDEKLQKAVQCNSFHYNQLIWIIFMQVEIHPADIPTHEINHLINCRNLETLEQTARRTISYQPRTTEPPTDSTEQSFLPDTRFQIHEDLRKLISINAECQTRILSEGINLTELTDLIIKYLDSRPNIKDDQNPVMIIIQNDPLGKILNIKAFHEKQTETIIKQYIKSWFRQ